MDIQPTLLRLHCKQFAKSGDEPFFLMTFYTKKHNIYKIYKIIK